jgi:hypothetical protein
MGGPVYGIHPNNGALDAPACGAHCAAADW